MVHVCDLLESENWPEESGGKEKPRRMTSETNVHHLHVHHLHVRARSFKYGRRPPCLFNTRPFITHMTILVDGRRIARISICTRDLICEYSWVYARAQEERSKMRSRGSNHRWHFRGCWMDHELYRARWRYFFLVTLSWLINVSV